MRRRKFLTLLGGAATVWPLAVRAQQTNGPRRVGVLLPFSADDSEIKAEVAAFVEQLQRLGWAENRNLHIDYRWTGGDSQKLQAYAKELVGLEPDLLFTRSTPATAALARNTRSIPIVFAIVSDPVGEGFVDSVARPGRNVTGFTNAEDSLTGKWLELLKEITPAIARVGFLFDPKVAPRGGAYYTGLIKSAAASYALAATEMPFHDANEIDPLIDDFARSAGSGGLIVLPDATTTLYRASIIALAERYRLPAVYAFRYFAEEGGLMSYGVDVAELCRRAAVYADRILKGAKPADLPVQYPEKFEFIINLKTARTLGLAISNQTRLLADQVIE
jgi:putative ABC transport system substrate-binding protein